MSFKNKVVLVTGASAGIGEATAILLAKNGAKLSLVGRHENNLHFVASKCAKHSGEKPLVIVADLSTDEGCERTAKETLEYFKRLDILINNAAVGARTCIEKADMATFDRVFNTDVRGLYNLTRLLVPALVEARGNIVNVSSISGSVVTVGSLPYSMAKAAIDHFTRLIALELAPKGVRVNAVSPGVTVSKFVQRITGYSDEEYESWLREVEAAIPLGRVCRAEDVAAMVVHLASEVSALVTGTVVQVDGGLQLAGAAASAFFTKQIQ